MNNKAIRVAFAGFGEINSPRDLIDNKCLQARQALEASGWEILTTPVITDDPAGEDVKRAISDLKKENIDLLVVCLAGWIPSHTVIALTQEFKNKPMILWGLAGDQEDGHIVTAAAQAGTTALRKVFQDLGYKFRYVYSIIGKPAPLETIGRFITAARAARALEQTRVGMMGFRDMKLYNTFYEGISLKSKLGTEIEFFEMLEMVQVSETINEAEIAAVLEKIKREWHFEKPIDDDFLAKGIRYYLAVKKIAEANGFDAISLKDVDGMKKILHFPPALIFMLLSDEMKVCTIPENDAMGAVTQLVIKKLTGQCGAYLEFYEFFENSVLIGVPDFVPAEVVEGKVKVTRAAFGGISGGLLNISSMKTGPLTMVRLSNTGDRYTMHIVTGEAKLRSWEEAGWDQPAPQLPSLEVFLDSPVDEFADRVSGQHYIIAYGDHVHALKDFCYLSDIKIV